MVFLDYRVFLASPYRCKTCSDILNVKTTRRDSQKDFENLRIFPSPQRRKGLMLFESYKAYHVLMF